MPKITRAHSTPYFEERFRKLPKEIQKIVPRKIFLFEVNPFHPGLDTHKLKGPLAMFWSFAINKQYRVLFRFLKNNEVVYYDIGTHDIYK
ncbi:MAG: type II toxin-antitoxin system RelE/ParE family toxin [bacterium]|nr:type II toxin-antitoxin system RelE/ParE family toxin [bacterium]